MSSFTWHDGVLHAGSVPVPSIAEAVGTPTYVYSAPAIREAYRRLAAAFAPLSPRIFYAVKASPNLHLCRLLHAEGAGMDVVSGGELERAWLAGVPMGEIVFAGVGKSDEEIRAALDGRFSPVAALGADLGVGPAAGRGPVRQFNAESESELESIARLAAELGVRARACVRVNPNVDAHTHEYTTTGKQENKFGIEADRVVGVFERWRDHPGIEMVGLHVHLGSPVPRIEAFVEAIDVLLDLVDTLEARGHRVATLDLGGGWPVPYGDQPFAPLEDYAEAIVPRLAGRVANGLEVALEPGRALVADAGVLLVRVQHVKHGREKTFVICDGGMQTLLRPSLYKAFHFVWPVAWQGEPPRREIDSGMVDLAPCDVVGPICETGDFLARGRALPPVAKGDLLAVFSAGAYGMSMASNYNDYLRPAEVLVDGDECRVINERQARESLLATERQTRELACVASAAGR